MGKLIILEGLDGSGKGTQTRALIEKLKSNNKPVMKISFPDYDSPSSSLVKMYLNGEFGTSPKDVNAYAASSFYAVDRYASYKANWQKQYKGEDIIVADRYATSNLVYQLGKLPKSDWDEYIEWSEDFEYEKLGIPRPDIVIYFKMPIEISQKLLSKRYDGDESKKDIHEANIAFLKQCAENAEYCAKKLDWHVIDCADGENPRSIDDIHTDVMKLLEDL